MKQIHFKQLLDNELTDLKELLLFKNERYGNSALEPIRIFSKADNKAQLKVRIDDKLSRITNKNIDDDEDVIKDLIGYLILYRIADKMDIDEAGL